MPPGPVPSPRALAWRGGSVTHTAELAGRASHGGRRSQRTGPWALSPTELALLEHIRLCSSGRAPGPQATQNPTGIRPPPPPAHQGKPGGRRPMGSRVSAHTHTPTLWPARLRPGRPHPGSCEEGGRQTPGPACWLTPGLDKKRIEAETHARVWTCQHRPWRGKPAEHWKERQPRKQ